MKKFIFKISNYGLVCSLLSCASYTVNICTIPPAEVEIYVNEQYHGTTSKDGKASIHIDPIEFENNHLIELKEGNFHGLLEIDHKGTPLEKKNVHYISSNVKQKEVNLEIVTYNVIFVVPDKLDDHYASAENENESVSLAETGAEDDYFAMTEAELDAEFDLCHYVATNDEIKSYKDLDVEAKREFLISFWTRRDEKPQTTGNEFRQDYFKRVELANARFSSRNKDGWKTDEGRVLIIYGIPDNVDRYPSNIDQKAYQIWYYNNIQGGVQFVFIDIRNFGEMKLLHSSAKSELKNHNWKEWLK